MNEYEGYLMRCDTNTKTHEMELKIYAFIKEQNKFYNQIDNSLNPILDEIELRVIRGISIKAETPECFIGATFCGACEAEISSKFSYCPYCGQKIAGKE